MAEHGAVAGQGSVRTSEQVSRERAMGEVSDVLTNVDHALTRARKALKNVARSEDERNIELTLAQTVRELEGVRKRLVQDGYFSGDAIRLI